MILIHLLSRIIYNSPGFANNPVDQFYCLLLPLKFLFAEQNCPNFESEKKQQKKAFLIYSFGLHDVKKTSYFGIFRSII